MDREQLADFLRRRRSALGPEDVGLPRGERRRALGLRREEVALLCMMSSDYYARLEQGRGPQPSGHMLAAIARGLRLTLDERDHLFQLAGQRAPDRAVRNEHVNPGLMRVLDRLTDTPALVITELFETLLQTPTAVALLGNQTHHTGLERSWIYRWFSDVTSRSLFPPEDAAGQSRAFTAHLRASYSRRGPRSRAAAIVADLLGRSPEFAGLWDRHEVGSLYDQDKRFTHPELGIVCLHCQVLHTTDQAQALLVFTATPGTADADKLALLPLSEPRRVH